MSRISVQMTVSLPPELYRKAMTIARKEIRTKSEVVRDALRYYFARKDSLLDARRKLAASLEQKGIKTLEDVERMIDELRA